VNVVGMEFVGKGHRAPDALPALGSRLFRRIPGLDHETLDVAVEGGAVVGPGCRQGQEIKGRARCRVAKDFDLEIANAGVDCDRHGWLLLLLLPGVLVPLLVREAVC